MPHTTAIQQDIFTVPPTLDAAGMRQKIDMEVTSAGCTQNSDPKMISGYSGARPDEDHRWAGTKEVSSLRYQV